MPTTPPDIAAQPAHAAWDVLRGPIPPSALDLGAAAIAHRHRLRLERPGPDTLVLAGQDGAVRVSLRWRPLPPDRPDTLGHVLPAQQHLQILIDPHTGGQEAAGDLREWLTDRVRRYDPGELAHIVASMPLLDRYATPDEQLAGWAVIVRDHYVENTLGLILALQRAGVPPRWIYALAKGDRTVYRDRVHATLLAQGCASGLLDNTAINAPDSHARDLADAMSQVDAFIDAAHADGRRVLVIDDGGLIAQGYGRADAARRVDAAIELTVSGLKRISAAGPLAVPVFNLARSQLKTRLGYPEIADSCLRRLRAMLPAVKMIGRPVLVLGYGALGSRLAAALTAQGCRVHVVDPDPLALICAAEAGLATHRTAAEALSVTRPVVVAGTTGENALTAQALGLLPDGAVLAPYATADFAALAEDPELAEPMGEIPGVGRRYRLPGGAVVTVLGDGRSLNLFEADAIPTQGYDAYRAGTLIAAKALCGQAATMPPGVHLADDVIAASGLYEAYYDTYLGGRGGAAGPGPAAAGAGRLRETTACVVGYGAAGRMHARILAEAGAELTILDPKHQDLPRTYRTFRHGVDDLPPAVLSGIGLWSVCCPTADHLPVLRSILTRVPDARVMLEKPACQGHEIAELENLLQAHPHARVTVIDQYRHARALDLAAGLLTEHAQGTPISHVAVTMTKDRTADIERGRFVDRSYGVLGYEWLHMLAALRQVLPGDALDAYLAGDPAEATLRAIYDPRLFVSTLTEHSTVASGEGLIHLELHSSITSPAVMLARPPEPAPPWQRGIRPRDDRHRYVTVHAGATQVTVHLDPVTTAGGWQLERNHHRVLVERAGKVLHEEVVEDSPLQTAIGTAAAALTGGRPLPELELGPLRRIAAIAGYLHAQQPAAQAPGDSRRGQPALGERATG